MDKWVSLLRVDSITTLKKYPDHALDYFIRRDLLEEKVDSIETLWELPEPLKVISKQADQGCWHYPAKSKSNDPVFNYDLFETYRSLRILIDMYGLDQRHPSIRKAADYVFSCQTQEGDIRGILGNQYMPYYHAVLLEELIKAGYENDEKVIKGLDWLLSVRQKDGGWIIPFQGVPAKEKNGLWDKAPIPPNRELPFSHVATGMILRALAVHPKYHHLPEVHRAGKLLKSRFFKPDKYYDRKGSEYWMKFQYPFFWPNLLTALNTLHYLGFAREDPDILNALNWFVENQQLDGLWQTEYNKGTNSTRSYPWVTLAVCRLFKRYYSTPD
jgi:hypothetical protein